MSAGATDPTPARPAFCPKCNGQMGQMDAKCPHCGYDFPTTEPGAHLLSLWAWFALIAVAIAAVALELDGWIQIAAVVSCVVFGLLRPAWRWWDRYWNVR